MTSPARGQSAAPEPRSLPRGDGRRWLRSILAVLAWPALAFAAHGPDAAAGDAADQPIMLNRFVVTDGFLSTTRDFDPDAARQLQNTPGLEFYAAGGVSELPVLHGLADDRLRIQINGMNLISACANHMNPPLSYLAPSNVGRITVYPAIVPVSVAGDSIGGAIIVDSPEPVFASAGGTIRQRGEAGAFFRSNGNVRGGHLTSSFATSSVSLAYDGALSKGGDYHAASAFKAPVVVVGTLTGNQTVDGETVGSSAFETSNHALRAAVQGRNQRAELNLGYQFIPRQGFPNQRMDMTLNRSEQATLRYHADTATVRVEARTYYEHTRHKMDFLGQKQYWYGSAATILAPGMPMNTEGGNFGTFAKAVLPVGATTELSAGVETQRYRLDDWWPPSPSVLPPGYSTGGMAPDTFWNLNGGQRDRAAGFAEWSTRWSQGWAAVLGLRHETLRMNTGPVQGYNNTMMYNGAPLYPATRFNTASRARTDRNWDLSAQLRSDPSPRWTCELGYALKTRSPNLYERYAWSTNTMAMEMINLAGDGNFYVGNLDLKPETAHTVAATVQVHDREQKEWAVTLSPYFTEVVHAIDVRRLPPAVGGASPVILANQTLTNNFVYLQYANQTAQLYGVDLTAHFPLAGASPVGALHGFATINVTRGRNLTTGDSLYQIPPPSAKLTLVDQIGRWTLTVETQSYAAKHKVAAVRAESRTAGYTVCHLRAAYAWSRYRVAAGVENLFNRFYTLPLGGAYTGQGPTMSGRTIAWGVGVPGPARSAYGSVTVSW